MTTTTTLPNIAKGEGTNPLKGLLAYRQSPWMDYVRRDLLTSGQLKKYIDNDGLRGMTSNPTIFEKAITGSNLYADILNSPEAKKLDANGLFEKIAFRDIQDACDIFKPVYTETNRREDVARILNVTEGNLLEQTIGIEFLCLGRVQNVGVKIATRDGLFENGGVRSHSAQAVVIDIFL